MEKKIEPVWCGKAAQKKESHQIELQQVRHGMVLEGMISPGDELIKLIERSRIEAIKRGIKANSIILNSRMVYVPGVIGELPAMICGLNVYVTRDELPEGYSFAVCEKPEEKMPTIPVDTVRNYLLRLIEEWSELGDRKYDLPNIQVYNHIRKELDDLEAYIGNIPNGIANNT